MASRSARVAAAGSNGLATAVWAGAGVWGGRLAPSASAWLATNVADTVRYAAIWFMFLASLSRGDLARNATRGSQPALPWRPSVLRPAVGLVVSLVISGRAAVRVGGRRVWSELVTLRPARIPSDSRIPGSHPRRATDPRAPDPKGRWGHQAALRRPGWRVRLRPVLLLADAMLFGRLDGRHLDCARGGKLELRDPIHRGCHGAQYGLDD